MYVTVKLPLCWICCELQLIVYYPTPRAILSLSNPVIFLYDYLWVSFVVINWSVLSCKKLLKVMGLPISSEWKLSVALSEFIIYADTWVHGCWEKRGCSNELSAAVDSGHCCCPWAFACWLMGLFGMPPLLDAEWWSGECVLLCLSPLWRLKGDRYLDTVPRLNVWNGMEGPPSQPRAGHLPSQGDMISGWHEKWYLLQVCMAMTLEVLNLLLYLL